MAPHCTRARQVRDTYMLATYCASCGFVLCTSGRDSIKEAVLSVAVSMKPRTAMGSDASVLWSCGCGKSGGMASLHQKTCLPDLRNKDYRLDLHFKTSHDHVTWQQQL